MPGEGVSAQTARPTARDRCSVRARSTVAVSYISDALKGEKDNGRVVAADARPPYRADQTTTASRATPEMTSGTRRPRRASGKATSSATIEKKAAGMIIT